MILTVYVPARPALHIRDGSGIVGSPGDEGGRVRIDYEGNIYGSPALRTYATRVFHAAGRHLTRYPTIARAWVLSRRFTSSAPGITGPATSACQFQ